MNAILPWYDLRASGGLSVYRAATQNRTLQPDWNQVRGFWNLSVPVGGDPGVGTRLDTSSAGTAGSTVLSAGPSTGGDA